MPFLESFKGLFQDFKVESHIDERSEYPRIDFQGSQA